jgi:lysophospholipase L1-like esterase
MNEKPFTVVVWGDSIAAGTAEYQWPALAERMCNVVLNTGHAVRVVNEGVGGKPAAGARHEFAERVLAHNPDLVIIQFGFNDIRYDGSRGNQPLSTPSEFGEHLQEMVRRCRQEAGANVVLFGNHRTRVGLTLPSRQSYDEGRIEYSALAQGVATRARVPFYDLAQELQMPEANWADFVGADGVHLSPLGFHAYAYFAANLIMQNLHGESWRP